MCVYHKGVHQKCKRWCNSGNKNQACLLTGMFIRMTNWKGPYVLLVWGDEALRKLSALPCVTSQHWHACWCGRGRHGRLSWQLPRNPPSCWEMDAGKSHRGSQHTVTNTHKSNLWSQPGTHSKYIFMGALECHRPSAQLPLMGFRLLTLQAPQLMNSSSVPSLLP